MSGKRKNVSGVNERANVPTAISRSRLSFPAHVLTFPGLRPYEIPPCRPRCRRSPGRSRSRAKSAGASTCRSRRQATAIRRISSSAPSPRRSSSIVRQARTFARADDLDLGRVGQDAPRRLARHLPAVDLVLHPLVPRHQPVDRRHVGGLRRPPPAGSNRSRGRGRPESPVASRTRRATRRRSAGRAGSSPSPRGAAPARGCRSGRSPRSGRRRSSARTPSRAPAGECSAGSRPSSGRPDCAGSCSRDARRTPRAARHRSTRPSTGPARCAGSRNWGRASRVMRGVRRISMGRGRWGSGPFADRSMPAPVGACA